MHPTLPHSWQAPDGTSKLGLLVKRSYRVAQGRPCRVLSDPPPVHVEQVRAGAAQDEMRPLRHETDLCAFERPLTDVVLEGSAHSANGAVMELDTSLCIGRAQKRVRVRGDRRLRVDGDGELHATEPEPFRTMHLEWTRAYGGRDRQAERRIARDPDANQLDKLGIYAYPRNPVGRGFAEDGHRELLDGMLLPNLDDPDDPVEPERLLAMGPTDWIDRPIAAGYGPVEVTSFPRCMFHLLRPEWLPPKQTIRELTLGGLLGADLAERSIGDAPDARIFNSAPAGLAVCRLQGNERVTLKHLHPRHALLEFDLPGQRPRLLIEPPNTKIYELEAVLQTVLLEPDEDRVTLTWTGSMPVAAVYPKGMCEQMRHGVVWES